MGWRTLDVWVVEGNAGVFLEEVLVLLHARGREVAGAGDGCDPAGISGACVTRR